MRNRCLKDLFGLGCSKRRVFGMFGEQNKAEVLLGVLVDVPSREEVAGSELSVLLRDGLGELKVRVTSGRSFRHGGGEEKEGV